MAECKPLDFLSVSDTTKILLILLNQSIRLELFSTLWSKAVFKVLCDGAANQVYDSRYQDDFNNDFLRPDLVSGDFDSIRDDTKTAFVSNGCRVELLDNQDETDFTKATRLAIQICQQKDLEYDVIVAYPAIGGRLDHTMANINTVFKLQNDKIIYLLSDTDIACLLKSGSSTIYSNSKDLSFLKKRVLSCGLIPIGRPADKVTTNGLKYNLAMAPLSFGSLLSTSNSIYVDFGHVTITTSHDLLFTVNYRPTE